MQDHSIIDVRIYNGYIAHFAHALIALIVSQVLTFQILDPNNEGHCQEREIGSSYCVIVVTVSHGCK